MTPDNPSVAREECEAIIRYNKDLYIGEGLRIGELARAHIALLDKIDAMRPCLECKTGKHFADAREGK